MDPTRPFLPPTKLTDQASTDQVLAQQKQVSFYIGRLPHQPEADSNMEADMETDPNELVDVRQNEEEGKLFNHGQDPTAEF